MPIYLYRDLRGHEKERAHPMLYSTAVMCRCGLRMWRVPQAAYINWNGSRAGQEPAPAVQELIRSAPRRRDAFLEQHEEHERRTGK